MKYLSLSAVLFVTVMFAGCAQQPTNTVSSPTPQTTETNTEISSPTANTAETTSRYIEYTDGALSNTTERRVLFFYASWCSTCQPTDADFKQKESQIPEDVTVVRVNYNDPDTDQNEKELAKKYGVTYQHTFVQIDAQGNEVTKWNGGKLTELLSRIK